ncbi:hypothetical protein [Flavobacterium sp.]|uniref:alpha/beta hydrolase n=1 Tax=Flavobacterium sp. TaxID=239 RepID=UPI0031D4D469
MRIQYYAFIFFIHFAGHCQLRIEHEFWNGHFSSGEIISNVLKLEDGSIVENNIVVSSLEFYKPEKPNGTAVLLIHGGGMYVLFSEVQGVKVAEWLNKQGISVFLFRHLLKKSQTGSPVQDLIKNFSLKSDYKRVLADSVFLKAASDAGQALKYLRECSEDFGVRPDKIGLMGFSTGAALGLELYKSKSKSAWPDFLIRLNGFSDDKRKFSSSTSFFIASISDTPFDETSQSIKLYGNISSSNAAVELHVYNKTAEDNTDSRWRKDLEFWLAKLKEN